MNTSKLKEALVELQQEQDKLANMILQLRRMIADAEPSIAGGMQDSVKVELKTVRQSYIEQAVQILEQSGKPMHVKDLAAKIAELRHAKVQRASVESSLIRHLSLGSRAKIAKFGPSLYGLPSWKGIIKSQSAAAPSFFGPSEIAVTAR
jgi:HB1/ASXL restriction endonuclease-like protein with HTH domain